MATNLINILGGKCKNGHVLTEERSRKDSNGHLRCKDCEAANKREYYKKNRKRHNDYNYAWRRRKRAIERGSISLDIQEDDIANHRYDDNKPSSPSQLLKPKVESREAYDIFQEALRNNRALCAGKPEIYTDYNSLEPKDDEFGEDFPTRSEARRLCEGCPVFSECETYSKLERPTVGVHAGIRWIESSKVGIGVVYDGP